MAKVFRTVAVILAPPNCGESVVVNRLFGKAQPQFVQSKELARLVVLQPGHAITLIKTTPWSSMEKGGAVPLRRILQFQSPIGQFCWPS